MSETPTDPSVQTPPAAETPAAPPAPVAEGAAAPAEAAPAEPAPPPPRDRAEASVRALLEAGSHFGHQTRRWNPQMRPFIFGERNGIHIIDLDQTLPRMVEALEFLTEVAAQGGKVLFVGTKRQASDPVRIEAERCGHYYVNNRWLGGMLTNFRTVKKSIEHFKDQLEILADEEKVSALSKRELSRLNRSVTKYRKSLDGIKDMPKLPDAMFVIDVKKEHIAITEARRLGIPIVAMVDTNCSPNGIDFVVPANDDAIRAIELYCQLVSDACSEGAMIFNERVTSQQPDEAPQAEAASGRRVVEIKPQGGGRQNRPRQAGGTHSAAGRPRREEPAPAGEAEAAPAAAPAAQPAAAAEPAAPAAPAAEPAAPAAPSDDGAAS